MHCVGRNTGKGDDEKKEENKKFGEIKFEREEVEIRGLGETSVVDMEKRGKKNAPNSGRKHLSRL